MRFCVFGSSSANLDPMYINAAIGLGSELASRGHGLVFGGYDTGLMGAVAKGAASENGHIIGIVTEGLNALGRDIFPCTEVMCTPDMARRKERMMDLSDAYIAMPGGLGTLDELFVVLSKVKAGEMNCKTAILNVGGFYDKMIEQLDYMTETGLNSSNWRDICGVFDNAAELVDWLEK